MGENALPLDAEDRERAIQIVGSTIRRLANAFALYFIFALPSLVMGSIFLAMEFGDLHPMDRSEIKGQLGEWLQLMSTILAVGLPNLFLIWIMFRVQTMAWWRGLIVQSYFRRALQIVVGIRVLSWISLGLVDGIIGLLVVAMIAIPVERLFGSANNGLDHLGIVIYLLLPTLVIMAHVLLWSILILVTGAITSGVMNKTQFPCLWCGHEQSPTAGDRCSECGISLSEAEVSRAKARGIYQPMLSEGSSANDFENAPSNA